MREHEGRGFLLRTGQDGPFAGWLPLRKMDEVLPFREAPWMALQALASASRAMPGGLALLWDSPQQWLNGIPSELQQAFFLALAKMPGLTLHLREAGFAEWLNGPIPGWFHASEPPTGLMGHAWRQGWIGWVPDGEPGWRLPGLGETLPEGAEGEPVVPGSLWGELILPVGALAEVGAEEVAGLMADVQSRLEWDFSLRLSAGAWPEVFPFQRRRAGWRVGLVGGREFDLGRGSWEKAQERLSQLLDDLRATLRCPIWAGACEDMALSARLGHQAMREGLPWRASLPMPPTAPVFSPGLAADPREPVPLESRCSVPLPLAKLLAAPPVAHLRVPTIPQDSAVASLLRGLPELPAIRWIPPEVPPPGPFTSERPWPGASAFPPLMDVTQALQPGLFDDLE